jgi:hypothetical protein
LPARQGCQQIANTLSGRRAVCREGLRKARRRNWPRRWRPDSWPSFRTRGRPAPPCPAHWCCRGTCHLGKGIEGQHSKTGPSPAQLNPVACLEKGRTIQPAVIQIGPIAGVPITQAGPCRQQLNAGMVPGNASTGFSGQRNVAGWITSQLNPGTRQRDGIRATWCRVDFKSNRHDRLLCWKRCMLRLNSRDRCRPIQGNPRTAIPPITHSRKARSRAGREILGCRSAGARG